MKLQSAISDIVICVVGLGLLVCMGIYISALITPPAHSAVKIGKEIDPNTDPNYKSVQNKYHFDKKSYQWHEKIK